MEFKVIINFLEDLDIGVRPDDDEGGGYVISLIAFPYKKIRYIYVTF